MKYPPKGDAYSFQDYSTAAAGSATAAGYGKIRRTLFSFLFIYWLMASFQTYTLEWTPSGNFLGYKIFGIFFVLHFFNDVEKKLVYGVS